MRFKEIPTLSAKQLERLLKKIKVNDLTNCWEWQSVLTDNGYGYVNINNSMHRAHRVAYHNLVGPVTHGKIVCHACDNRKCINPEHLFLGSSSDNRQDMISKGRMRKPYQSDRHKT